MKNTMTISAKQVADTKKMYYIRKNEDDKFTTTKLNVTIAGGRTDCDMTVDRKTLKGAYKVFAKAVEQAVSDGIISAKVAEFANFADDVNDIDFGGKDSVTFTDSVDNSFAYGIDDNSDCDGGYFFWFWCDETAEVDPAEYAISEEAMQVAVDAEIELANVKAEPETAIVEQYTGLTKERDLIIDSAQVTVEQAVAIIDRLNYRHCSFEYRHTTNDDIAEYRHFDAYRDGDKDAFAITEVVIDGVLDSVRFYNLFRNIRVDLKICKPEVEMPKISAKQVADAKATMQFIETCANNNQIPDAEWNAAVDRYNAAKAIVAASEITSDQIGLTINTALVSGKVSLKVDGNKISMANAFKAALAQDKAIVLRNEVGDFCIIDRHDDILTLGEFNFKTAIRQFANGEKVQGSTVMNKHQVHVIKAAEVVAQPEVKAEVFVTIATVYCPFSWKGELETEHYPTIETILEEIPDIEILRCNPEEGIAVTVKLDAQDKVEEIFDSYGLDYSRHVFKKSAPEPKPEPKPEPEVKADLSAPLARLAEVKVKVDRANEEHLKLSFAAHVSMHFYLNELKSELFNKHIFPNQDRVRKMLNPAVDAIYDELVAADHLSGWDNYGELLDYCVKTAATGSSNAVWRQARDIANAILDKLGEQALADELKKIVDEYGISRELLTKSGDCDFNPALFADKLELAGVYVDWEGEKIPAADYAEILDGLAITDYTTTAYRKNADGTFSEDRAAWLRIREAEGTREVPAKSVEPEPAPTPEVVNGEMLEIIPDCLKDGATLIQVDSPKYGATLTRYSDGRIYYRIETPAEYPTPSTARNVTEDEFFQTLAQRGAWTPDEPPADDFASELARLEQSQSAAKAAELAAKAVYKAAADKYEACRVATQKFLDAHAAALTAQFRAITLDRTITLIRSNGRRYDYYNFEDVYVDAFNAFGQRFLINGYMTTLANYDTPEQVETAIEQLKSAIERGDKEFTFPTIEDLNPTVQEVAEQCARINESAPADWLIRYDSERGDFAIEYRERRVGTLTACQLVAANAKGFFDKYAA